MISVTDAVREFVRLADADGDTLTPRRAELLVYLAEGSCLAWFGEALAEDRFVADESGPVPVGLRAILDDIAKPTLTSADLPTGAELPRRHRDVIAAVWRGYREFSAIGLAKLAKSHAPWRQAARGGHITRESMRDYFGAEYERATGEPAGTPGVVDRQAAEGKTIRLADVLAKLPAAV